MRRTLKGLLPQQKITFSGLLLKLCQKKQESLNRQDAKDAKFKTRIRGIVQNRVTVLDNAAFSFAACLVKREACLTGATRQMKKPFLPSLATFASLVSLRTGG